MAEKIEEYSVSVPFVLLEDHSALEFAQVSVSLEHILRQLQVSTDTTTEKNGLEEILPKLDRFIQIANEAEFNTHVLQEIRRDLQQAHLAVNAIIDAGHRRN